jgi:hypothetical protein
LTAKLTGHFLPIVPKPGFSTSGGTSHQGPEEEEEEEEEGGGGEAAAAVGFINATLISSMVL